jgi:hypothetical protein
MEEFEDLPLLPAELEEKLGSIKQPYGGLFGNSVLARVIREIVADPCREFRPKSLEILTSSSAPRIKNALDTLTALEILKKISDDTQRPVYVVNFESKRLTALTFLAYAVTDDRDGTECMYAAIKDYYDYALREKYEPSASTDQIVNYTLNIVKNEILYIVGDASKICSSGQEHIDLTGVYPVAASGGA